MKRLFISVLAFTVSCAAMLAQSRALYVKDNEGIHRYAFGVADVLQFSNDGKSLYIKGYDSTIDLSQVDYMTFDMPTDGQLSSTQQKDRLLEIGEKLYSKINAYDASDIIGFGVEFGNLEFCDMDAIFDRFKEHHPDLFDDDEDYYDYCYKALSKLVKAMSKVGKGNCAASRQIGATYTELFTRDDFNGVFTADTKARKWVKTADADYFELIFKGPSMGKNYSLRIETSPDFTVWSEKINIKEWDGSITSYDVTGHAPSTITGTVKMENSIIFSGVVGITLNQDAKSIDVVTTANCANVKVDDVIAIRNNSATDNLTMRIKDEVVITTSTNLTGSQLLNVPEWVEDLQGVLDEWEYEHYNEYYYEMDGRKILRKFGKVVSNADILGELQLQGHISNYDNSYDELEEYTDGNDNAYNIVINHDKRTITYIYGAEYWTEKIANVLNNYTDASFYYDKSNLPQGFITWKTYEDIDDSGYTTTGYWDDNTDQWIDFDGEYTEIWVDYELIPYMTFADGSSFAFDSKYFTGSNFQKLVDDAESIADIIDNIINDYEFEDPYDKW